MFWRVCFSLCLAGCVVGAPRNNNIGAQYLGAKYVSDPLGEGTGYDADPLIRDDAFDCVTFVETAMADGDVARLTKIRYKDGIVGFERRNHFIETDWLTNNADIVENISRRYGTTHVRNVLVDKRAWARALHDIDINASPTAASLEYIAYRDVKNINNSDALIVLFVVGAAPGNSKAPTDMAVAHMGFLLPGGRILRHASTGRGVVDDNFAKYIEMRRRMNNNIGIALVKIK